MSRMSPRGRSNTGITTSTKRNAKSAQKKTNLANMIPKNRSTVQKDLDGEEIGDNESVGAELDLRDRNQLKLSNSIFKREACPLDHKNAFTGVELNTHSTKCPRTAEDNKKQYLDSYSVGFPIPSFYVLESTIWTKNPAYVIQLVKIVIPDDKNLKVIEHSV